MTYIMVERSHSSPTSPRVVGASPGFTKLIETPPPGVVVDEWVGNVKVLLAIN